ncbi:MAG TPA: GDSL-type esterase/lipase family protein [Xanthobacteraceae bacterium]|jgi:lysophospholipase L1-like esterase|nr:GDSL-type esterase/lipase family protein [Xanthobacteraceae bacterium]
MARTQRDRLSFAAVLLGGACLALIAAVLIVVLRAPAVPRPRGLITVVEEVAPAVAQRPQVSRDDARIPSAAEPAPPARVASAPPAADSGAAPPAATTPVVETSTLPLKSSTSPPGNSAAKTQGQRGLVILQIGDSHTAADYFTGELRQKLQARYGNGGVGYIDAGKPHIGVRSGAMKITASAGWTYHAIQRSDNIGEFWLSGFNAVATASGEALTFASDTPVPFDAIEIEALRQPGGGAIDISLDGTIKSSADLGGSAVEPVVLRLRPDGAPTDRVRNIEIRTRGGGAVSIASIGIYQKQAGVSYNNIGYPGATIDLVNKFDEKLMADGLRRLDPQIVVLVFGTNEASKPNLDAARYERNYEKAIARIKAALPNVQIVLVGPPDGAERPPHCSGKGPADAACHPAPPSDGSLWTEPADCDWHTIAHLDLVRDIERRIAQRHGFVYWNWATINPNQCAAHQLVAASPPLMTPDHVHFTPAGYVKGADLFLDALIPVIEKLQVRPNITASN